MEDKSFANHKKAGLLQNCKFTNILGDSVNSTLIPDLKSTCIKTTGSKRFMDNGSNSRHFDGNRHTSYPIFQASFFHNLRQKHLSF